MTQHQNLPLKFDVVAAIATDGLIGTREYGTYAIPWPVLKGDLDFFREITTRTPESMRNVVIVGRNTWLTLPARFKSNPSRVCVVITNCIPDTSQCERSVNYATSFESAYHIACHLSNVHRIFVIGGAAIYATAIAHPMLRRMYITHVDYSYPEDIECEQRIYFPLTESHFDNFIKSGALCHTVDAMVPSDLIVDAPTNTKYTIVCYQVNDGFSRQVSECENLNPRISSPVQNTSHLLTYIYKYGEQQYIDLVRNIMDFGITKTCRNDVTKSIFGCQLRFDLSRGYPIYTVKKSYPKSIFEELMWMIRGQTDVKILRSRGVNIWNKNSSQEYLEKYGLPWKQDDIGPGYGFQMRHYGAEYIDCHTDYTGQGVDQLANCIDLINNDPSSRRIIINLWNPNETHRMALPPCHAMYQFTVDEYETPNGKHRGQLNCHLFQRSWDVMLGWNTTTAALLCYLLAHHCGLDPGTLVHSVTDAHIYQTHIDGGAVDELLKRNPRCPPRLSFVRRNTAIEDYEYSDMVLEGYQPCPPIKATMIA